MANDIVITDLRGGRNGIDSPLTLPDNQCVEALNVDWEDGQLATKRRGASEVTTGAIDVSVGVRSLYRHVPDGDEAAAELWGVTLDARFFRLTTSGWAVVTATDGITGEYQDVAFCTFNGKLFIAYKSGVNRLHVWDPALSKIRRVGLAQPGAPTLANQGSGSLPATARYYRVRYIDYDGSTIKRRSEPSASATITPSGTGLSVRVTRPSLLSEDETHWEVELAAAANGPWYVVAGVANGNPILAATTTFDDTTLLTALDTLETAEESGSFTLPTAARYLATDGNRILMAGTYTSEKTSRVWMTPVLGTSDHGDDERIVVTSDVSGYLDLNEKDGGKITGLANPIGGTPLVFKYRQSWKLLPTQDNTAPYIARRISSSVGCVYFKSIVEAEDARGNPMIAWLSHKGPWAFAANGLVKVGRDVDDIWFGRNDYDGNGVNLTASIMPCWGLYHTDRNQIWWFVARGSYTSPDAKLMLDVRRNVSQDEYGMRGGWALHTGKSCKSVCGAMFSRSAGASMSIDLKPYLSYLEPS